jgi:hypothetical protein
MLHCHGAETNTDFVQIKQHALQPSQGSATLSCFLTGNADVNNSKSANYRNLLQPDPTNTCQVPVSFYVALPAAPDGGCSQQTLTTVRIFSDLSRRVMHLGAVLKASSQFDADGLALIQSYAPDFRH